MSVLISTLQRRFQRMRRRRKVGRAYDMALEISRVLEPGAEVLDVGCGNGFIAHHLTSLLGARVVGLDVGEPPSTPINFLHYDGRHFPLVDSSFDAVLLCYVLHHTQNYCLVLEEVRRVLRDRGVVVIYEDNPGGLWDKAICWTHNLQWQRRTGKCTFQVDHEWQKVFRWAGFDIVMQRRLSRWRNMAHPVSRSLFVLQNGDGPALHPASRIPESTPLDLKRKAPVNS